MWEFEVRRKGDNRVRIVAEKHYWFVEPEEVKTDDLEAYGRHLY